MPDTAYGFQFHPGTESGALTTEFLGELAEERPDSRIGATIHIPRRRLQYWQAVEPTWSPSVDFLVGDPECGRMDRPYTERGAGRDDYAYLAESDPAANAVRFVKQAIDAQTDVGADVLISPWLLHGVTQTEHELAATIRFASLAEEYVEDEDKLLMGVEATSGVFATAEARNAFVNELVEGPELPVYLRMRGPTPPGYMQLRDQQALLGLREVVKALRANDRPLALPQSGLTGWLMCGFGASSFGAGVQGSMQRNSAPAGGGGGFPPLHWYFVPQLLGFVLAEEMEDVSELGTFEACQCPYCDGQLPGPGAAFDARAAGRHFIWWCSTLVDELDPDDPHGTVSGRVLAASQFFSEVEAAVQLDERSVASHLALWEELLSSDPS
jgi:hypothetical protein